MRCHPEDPHLWYLTCRDCQGTKEEGKEYKHRRGPGQCSTTSLTNHWKRKHAGFTEEEKAALVQGKRRSMYSQEFMRLHAQLVFYVAKGKVSLNTVE